MTKHRKVEHGPFWSVFGDHAEAIQPNGERLRVERWVVEAWLRDESSDSMLNGILDRALVIYCGW